MTACPSCGYQLRGTGRTQLGVHRFNRGMLPMRIVDLLEVDSPLTSEQIAGALQAKTNSVFAALWRLYKDGAVTRTQRPEWVHGAPTARYTWRLT